MTRQDIAAIVSVLFLLGGAGAAAAPQGTSPGQSEKPKEMAVTGCVIQGSAPDVLLLDDARFNPQNKDEKGRTYLLVAGVQDLALRDYLNKEVRVTGEAQLKAPPPSGQKATERDLPRLSARSIATVADRCTIASW